MAIMVFCFFSVFFFGFCFFGFYKRFDFLKLFITLKFYFCARAQEITYMPNDRINLKDKFEEYPILGSIIIEILQSLQKQLNFMLFRNMWRILLLLEN
jgi:hypothetical protein